MMLTKFKESAINFSIIFFAKRKIRRNFTPQFRTRHRVRPKPDAFLTLNKSGFLSVEDCLPEPNGKQ